MQHKGFVVAQTVPEMRSTRAPIKVVPEVMNVRDRVAFNASLTTSVFSLKVLLAIFSRISRFVNWVLVGTFPEFPLPHHQFFTLTGISGLVILIMLLQLWLNKIS